MSKSNFIFSTNSPVWRIALTAWLFFLLSGVITIYDTAYGHYLHHQVFPHNLMMHFLPVLLMYLLTGLGLAFLLVLLNSVSRFVATNFIFILIAALSMFFISTNSLNVVFPSADRVIGILHLMCILLLVLLFIKYPVPKHLSIYTRLISQAIILFLIPALSYFLLQSNHLFVQIVYIVVFLSLAGAFIYMLRKISFRKNKIQFGILFFLLLIAISAAVSMIRTTKNDRPNVIHITLDTLRMVSFREDTMPFLYDFKDRSAYFPNSYSDTDNTLPTHNAILYGKHASIVGFEPGPYPDTTLPQLLRWNNYHTAMISANGRLCIENGFNKGFDDYYEAWKSENHVRQMFLGHEKIISHSFRLISPLFTLYRDKLVDISRSINKKPMGHREYRYFNYEPAEVINEFVKTAVSRSPKNLPYYLFVNYLDAHEPYVSPDTASIDRIKTQLEDIFPDIYESLDMERFSPADTSIFTPITLMWPLVDSSANKEGRNRFLKFCYEENIKYLDKKLAELFQHFKDNNLLENTLIVITSDHGESLGEHNLYKHRNYRLYNEEIRVPLMIHFPESMSKLTAGKVLNVNTQSVDLFPTTLDFLGISEDIPLSGISLLPFVFGLRNPDEARFALSESLGISAIADEQYKVIIRNPYVELYDWVHDPGEGKNLAGSKRDRAMALLMQLERQRMQTYVMKDDRKINEFDPTRFDEETLQQLRSLGYIK